MVGRSRAPGAGERERGEGGGRRRGGEGREGEGGGAKEDGDGGGRWWGRSGGGTGERRHCTKHGGGGRGGTRRLGVLDQPMIGRAPPLVLADEPSGSRIPGTYSIICWMRRRSFPPRRPCAPLDRRCRGYRIYSLPLRHTPPRRLPSSSFFFFFLVFFIPLRFPPPRADRSALATGHHSRAGWPPPRARPRPHLGGEGATAGWLAGQSPPSMGWLPSLPPAVDLQTPGATAHRGARCWAVVFHKGHTGRRRWDWGRESGGCRRSSPLSPPIGI